jgi:hypothetical protein
MNVTTVLIVILGYTGGHRLSDTYKIKETSDRVVGWWSLNFCKPKFIKDA